MKQQQIQDQPRKREPAPVRQGYRDPAVARAKAAALRAKRARKT